MKIYWKWVWVACLCATVAAFSSSAQFFKAMNTRVVFHTSEGDFTVDLLDSVAPISVDNFLSYVRSGFYEGTIFHRVIPNTIVQGGGFTETLERKPTQAPIVNEANRRFGNEAWTIAMARTSDPNSATSQFYFNLRNNPELDPNNQSDGYAVFGRVVSGRDVLQRMGRAPIDPNGPMPEIPAKPTVIESIEIID